MDPLLGQTPLNRYRIEAFVGRGGMADVYKAFDLQRNAYVAIKLLREDLAQDLVFRRKFRREATVLQTLNHPNVVRFYSFEEQDLLAFMVLEYIAGRSLRALIASKGGEPFSPGEALTHLAPMCSALQYGHSEGVFHCDVKPGNVLIEERSGRVLVSDFGIAKLAESATTTVSTPGTPAYMSPEQCRGKGLDQRTDIYSLGITLYEMLTGGERPFVGERAPLEGTTGEKIRWEHINEDPVPPSAHNHELPPAADGVILKALAKDAGDRYGSVMEFLGAYQEAVGETGAAPPMARVPATSVAIQPLATPAKAAPSVTLSLPVVAGIIVAVIALMGGVLVLSQGRPAPAAPAAPSSSTATWTATPLAASPTRRPTSTPVPPTATPVPPTSTSRPATATPGPPTATPRTAAPRAAAPTATPKLCFQGEVTRMEEIAWPLIQIHGVVLDERGQPLKLIMVRIDAGTTWYWAAQTWPNGAFGCDILAQPGTWFVSLPEIAGKPMLEVKIDHGERAIVTFRRVRC